MQLWRTLQILAHLVRMQVKTRLEYRAAFLLGIAAQFFSYGCGYAVIWVLLLKFDSLGGWRWPELALLFSFQLLTYALGAAASFTQMRELETKVRLGTFDVLLVKPISPWAYLVFSGMNIGYLGHIALAAGLMAWSLAQLNADLPPLSMLYLVAAIISGAVVNAAIINMIGACALILVQSRHLFTIYFGIWELARYPLSIFPASLQWLMISIVPLGLAAYVPVAALLNKPIVLVGDWGPVLALLAGPIMALIAAAQWRYAIARYQGAGG